MATWTPLPSGSAPRSQDPTLNKVTVYRTLAMLKKYGLVDELDLMHLDGGKHYYEARTTRDHIHLACLKCGRIQEFESSLFEKLKGQIEREQQFRISTVRVEAAGSATGASDESAAGRYQPVILYPYHPLPVYPSTLLRPAYCLLPTALLSSSDGRVQSKQLVDFGEDALLLALASWRRGPRRPGRGGRLRFPLSGGRAVAERYWAISGRPMQDVCQTLAGPGDSIPNLPGLSTTRCAVPP